MAETSQIAPTDNSPYSLVGATFGGMKGQVAGGVADAQKILASNYGYTGAQDGILSDNFLTALYGAQNQQKQAGQTAFGSMAAFNDYLHANLRGGQNTAPGQTPSAGTDAANANLPPGTPNMSTNPAPLAGTPPPATDPNNFTNPYTGITYNKMTGAIISDPQNKAASIGQAANTTPGNIPLNAQQQATYDAAVKGLSPTQQGFNAAQANGGTAPQTGGAATNTQQYTAPAPVDTSGITQTIEQDKGYQQLLKDQADYNSTVNQQKSLTDTYQQMIDKAGIPGIDTQLLNSKKIIDGTEDDIRKEVQATNGFATDSQVLALSSARNKTLIQNYNNLLDTKNMAMQNIQTMIGLSKDDQQTALQNITQKMNIDQQLADYQTKFVNNAREGFNTIIGAVGISGLYNGLMNSDPSGRSLQQASQVLGISPAQIQQLAQADAQQRAAAAQTQAMDLQGKQLDLTGKQLNNTGQQLTNQKTQQEINNTNTNPTAPTTYQLTKNDTGGFYAIAQKLGLSQQALMAANQGVDPNNMKVGQVINLPNSKTNTDTTDTQLKQQINNVIGSDPSFKLFTHDQKTAYIQSMGGNPKDYQY